jgi:hypothetical protein
MVQQTCWASLIEVIRTVVVVTFLGIDRAVYAGGELKALARSAKAQEGDGRKSVK